MPLLALLCLSLLAADAVHAQAGGRVLVYSRTTGYRHESIASGIAAVRSLGTTHGFAVTATESASAFTAAGLSPYDAVVFLNTTGDVLDATQQAALEGYVQAGGGFVGVHAAADTEYDWPWYGGLVGAYFASHPAGTPAATVAVVDRVHPSTATLPLEWARIDEWYNFRASPRGRVHVLATLDERTYTGGTMRGDHPIAWCHAYDGGRSFYTAGGHTAESFTDAAYVGHLWGGLAWAAGWAEGNCTATVETSWERTVLDPDVSQPMELAVAPDGRVFFVERGGAVKIWDPATEQTLLAATLPVTTSYEDGLLGITLDPAFAQNGWAYLYYSRAAEPLQRVSRFTVVGNTLSLASEAVLLTVQTDRDEGGHSGGSLAFGPDGLLYVATGDDTDPFDSGGYAPIDERTGRASWDAQRTSANPFDLRGKVLRVRPLAGGGAAVPPGNLFPADGTAGRPEIYAMGVRNPFRLSVDPATGWLYWGDVGPDATDASPGRGPRGYDEVNQARTAGFYGWPYCTANNVPYRDFNFATGASGPPFNCAAPVNASPNVAGAPVALPPARPAWAWYPYATSPEFPDLPDGNGRTAMAGPVVRRGAGTGAENLPAYFDGSVFVYEWSRNWIVETHLDADGQPLAFQRFLPGLVLHSPIDLELGPDGALYMLEWGDGFGNNNPDAALSRIAYVSGTRAPVVAAQATPTSGPLPLAVAFTSAGTSHPEGLPLAYAWDLDGDGTVDATTPDAARTYTAPGAVAARLTVTDTNGRSVSTTLTIVAGNSEPVVAAAAPVDGGFYAWGDTLRFDVAVSDAEDGSTAAGTVDCARVVVQPGVGHDDHNHPLEEYPGCTGAFASPSGHGADAENVFLVVEARYTDDGAQGVGALTGRRQIVVRPKRLEAEHFTRQSGVEVEPASDWAGVENVAFIDDGDWIAFEPVNLLGVPFLTFRVASDGAGGRIEARLDAPDGPLVATALVAPTGGWQTYRDVTVPVTDPGGTHALYLVFRNDQTASGLFNLNWVRAHGPGAAEPRAVPEGLVAEYFASSDLSGAPTVRTDPQVSFDWGAGAPLAGLPADGFSVRWSGLLRVPAAGRYRFTTATDDGAQLVVNGAVVVDAWDGGGFRQQSGSATLPAGLVPIRLEYRDLGGAASAAVLWSGPNLPLQTVSEDRLVADPDGSTGTDPAPEARLALALPRPNPGRTTTEIAFDVPELGAARVELYDALGRRVMVLHDGPTPAGRHTLNVDVSGLPSGVYVVRLAADAGTLSRTLTVVR